MRTAFAVTAFLVMSAPLAAQHAGHQMPAPSTPPKAAAKPAAAHKMAHTTPASWKTRLDKADAKTADFQFHKMGNELHFMTGPAGIAWSPANQLKGNFTVGGTFELGKVPEHPEAYGLVVGGENLDKDNQSYVYFLIRHDGKFLINHRAGTEIHRLVPWSSSPAIVKPGANGKSKNALTVDAGSDKIRFMINGKQVAAFDRDKPMTAHGLAGMRVNHNLEVHVSNFKITRR